MLKNKFILKLIILGSLFIGLSTVLIFVYVLPKEKPVESLGEIIAKNITDHSSDWDFKQVCNRYDSIQKTKDSVRRNTSVFKAEFIVFAPTPDYVFENKKCNLKFRYMTKSNFDGDIFYIVTLLKPDSICFDSENSKMIGESCYNACFKEKDEKEKHICDSIRRYHYAYTAAYNKIIINKIKSQICN